MQDINSRANVQGSSFTALIVEDEPDYALMIQKCLLLGEPTPQIRHAQTLRQAITELNSEPVDVVLLDLNLPDSLGLDTVRAVNAAAPLAATIVITASGGEDIARLMLRGGAQDFLTKDELDSRTLKRAIAHAIERKRADKELRASRSQVRQLQMSHDAILRATPAALASLRDDWSVVWANDSMKQLFDAVERPGTSLRELFPSDESFAEYTASSRARTAETLPDRRELVIKLPAGQTCVCELNLVRLNPEETAAGYLATLVDVTDRAMAEAQRESLIRLAQRLSNTADEQELGQIVAEECTRVFKHDAFWFSRYSAAQNSLRHFWIEDTAIGASAPSPVPVTRQLDVLPYQPAFANGKPRLVNRALEADQTAEQPFQRIGHVHRKSLSLMFAPIVWQNEVLGVISVQSYHPHRYHEPELELLGAFADQCGTAMARIHAAEELQRSETLYREIVEDQSELIVRFSTDFTLTFCNQSFARTLHTPSCELISSNYMSFVAHADQKRIRLLLNLIKPTNPAVDIEHALLGPDKETFRLIWTYRGNFDEAGNVIQYQAVGSDVTRLRIAESALARSEQRLELIVSQIPALLYTTDEELRITSVLGRFAGIDAEPWMEKSPGEIMGRHVSEVLTGLDDEGKALKEAHELSVKTGVTATFMLGSANRQYQASVQPLRRTDGVISGVVGIALDVTERLQTEQEQRRLQEELHAAEKLAVIGRAMASIGHCMKNMLTGLNGGMFLVDRCCDTADSVNPVLLQAQDLLKRSTARISLLLLNMLDISKDRHANFCVSNIEELLDEVIAILRTSALAEGVEVYSKVDPSAREFCLDTDRLYRALLNLGLNSLDAMQSSGQLLLSARLASSEEVQELFRECDEACSLKGANASCRAITSLDSAPNEPMLRIDVSDSGDGINPEILHRLFEPFFSTKCSRGTGLGLSATLQFIQSHDGHILVRSELHRGTTITLLLPQRQPASVSEGNVLEVVSEQTLHA
ncbi:MAG: PAS domain-containing protein [Candidatus Sumerlaeaceae bacterium]